MLRVRPFRDSEAIEIGNHAATPETLPIRWRTALGIVRLLVTRTSDVYSGPFRCPGSAPVYDAGSAEDAAALGLTGGTPADVDGLGLALGAGLVTGLVSGLAMGLGTGLETELRLAEDPEPARSIMSWLEEQPATAAQASSRPAPSSGTADAVRRMCTL